MCFDYIKLNCYIDNELPQGEKNLIEKHLLSCTQCRIQINNLTILNRTILGLPKLSINENFVNKVLSKLEIVDHPDNNKLEDYCNNLLSTSEYNKIDIHTEECEKCRITVNEIKNSSKNYFEQFEFKTSGDFLSGIFDKIEAIEEQNIHKLRVVHITNTEISAFIDNQLENIEREEVLNHIKECTKCKNKLEVFSLTRNTILNLTKPVIHFNFSKSVLEHIEPKKDKIVSFSNFMRKFIPTASMAAGLLVIGTFLTLNDTLIDNEPVATQAVNITVRSEDLLFAPQSQTYRTDAIDVLSDNSQDDSLMIEDIGL